jgi:excisionase family DNA binding protein
MAGKTTDAPEALLTLREVARRLACSEKSVRRLVDAGDLPVVRIGRMVRVDPLDLARFVRVRREG